MAPGQTTSRCPAGAALPARSPPRIRCTEGPAARLMESNSVKRHPQGVWIPSRITSMSRGVLEPGLEPEPCPFQVTQPVVGRLGARAPGRRAWRGRVQVC